jgi:hypothetical protein
MLLDKFFVKCCHHRSMSQLGCRHLSPATPPASTSGETSSASHVLSKGSVVRVLLVRCQSIEPWVCPYANNVDIIDPIRYSSWMLNLVVVVNVLNLHIIDLAKQ